MTTSRSLRAAGAASLVLAGSLGAAACGSQTSPPPKPPKVAASACASQIAQLERQTAEQTSSFGGGVVLTAAAMLSATVEVEVVPGPRGNSCTILQPGKTLMLTPGEKAVFEANTAPTTSGATTAVEVSTSPGVSSPPPLQTPHVIVTVSALAAGTVHFAWTNCSGTGC